ncbi:MAG TPA: hypothetical protein DGT23_03960 [Micromonosporaceae bacterium]|nr:hypothetical protein [Micromonosporaceae bacterium]
MKVTERAALTVTGIEVVAGFGDLRTAVPAAWTMLFSRCSELPAPQDGVFVEMSTELGKGRYREVVGVAVEGNAYTPQGMRTVRFPAGRFLHHRHEGQVKDITLGFEAMYAWAAETGLRLGPRKVDVGYRLDSLDGPHDLFIDIVE